MSPLIIVFALPSIFLTVDFIRYLLIGERYIIPKFNRILELISIVAMPLFYLFVIDERTNDCCTASATFSPEHQITIFSIILICVIAYFVSTYKKRIISPILETLINAILLGAIILNVFISIQVEEFVWLFGNLPIILLFLFELISNHKKIAAYSQHYDFSTLNGIEKISLKILNSEWFVKIPILLILCLPILVFISGFLLLFGQKPDSIIRAFTDTYKHGFSQLDYLCDNVECGGHFLCSVAANGHKSIVTPTRLGERRGHKIMCNRQLLISNAFEDLMEEILPRSHKVIRTQYNKVGNLIHRYYSLFNLKIVADIVYILMKPLEWFFLFVLYTFDQNPENRIAKQYLSSSDRKTIDEKVSKAC